MMTVARLPSPAPSRQSLLALCWLNFFLSGMQAAFGPIAAAYLGAQAWTARDIGFVLSIGGIAGLASQLPGGELLDTVRAKRLLVTTAVVTVASSILILRLWPSFLPVALAQVLQGITGGVLGSGVVAITLGLVGHAGLADQLGQNQRFAAAGGVTVTLTMAVVAYSESPWAMLVPVTLAVPVLLALFQIPGDEIDFLRASGAEDANAHRPRRASRHGALLRNRRLLIFAACVVLFQLANASMQARDCWHSRFLHSFCQRQRRLAPPKRTELTTVTHLASQVIELGTWRCGSEMRMTIRGRGQTAEARRRHTMASARPADDEQHLDRPACRL